MTWTLIRPIWRLPKVTATQRLLLLALASFTDRNQANAYPSQSTLARMCCCTTRTIRRVLSELIAMKLIEKQGKARGGTIRYRVNVNVLPMPDSDVLLNRTRMSTNQSNNNPSNRNPIKSNGSINFNSGFINNPQNRTTRTTGNQSMTDQAIRLAAEKRQRT